MGARYSTAGDLSRMPAMTEPMTQRAKREADFTLLEILVAIVILGLLIDLVAPAALRQLGGARISVAPVDRTDRWRARPL
jgi:prepilin-type N-terminal cleavage/methylation domain-containing protein